MATKTTKKSKTAKQPVSLTIAEANRLQSKLRTAIRSTTELTEKKNLDPEAIKKLKIVKIADSMIIHAFFIIV